MKPLAPNTLLQNRYLIVQLIGKGGMGEVYLAVDQRLGSAIAIKRTYFTEDELLGGAFEREARTLARLRHPVLPKVSDHFLENENQYIVMEHISGDDLSKRLESNKKPFPINWVLFWADQLLDALNYLHSHEPPIIHRDIKPQNLKLTADNQIILLDFGLAKDSVGQTKITTTGSVVGFTPHYAPMEQIRGTGTNPRSDIYSLSATLYQLLTNTVPFDALTRADSLLNGVPDPVQPIYEINKEVPKPISDIILKGMSVSQEQRYGNAREMQKILRDAFSAMQSAMAAQTIAFNLQDELKAEELSPAQPAQDNFATMVNEPPFQQRIDSESSAYNLNPQDSPRFDAYNPTENSSVQTPPNFDATVKMEDFQAFDSKPQQAGIKTEVFLAGDLADESKKTDYAKQEENDFTAANEIAPQNNYNSQPKGDRTENYNTVANGFSENAQISNKSEEYKTSEENFSEQPDFLKTEYVPASDYSAKKADSFESASASSVSDDAPQYKHDEPRRAEAKQFPPPLPPNNVEKKSGGKGLAVAAGLFALIVLLAGGGFGGWYVYKNYVAVEKPTPTPAPSPSLEITPEATPQPTIAETNSSNSNTELGGLENSNSDTGNTNSSVNTDTGNTSVAPPVNSAPRQTQTVRPTPAPRQTPVGTINTPPRPTPPQQPKRTPAPQSTPRSRTDLIKP